MSYHSVQPSRHLHWVSSVDPRQEVALDRLQGLMQEYYRKQTFYYTELGTGKTAPLWDDGNALGHVSITAAARSASRILEVGCGTAALVRTHAELAAKYTGIDFSPDLLERNHAEIRDATFNVLEKPGQFPFNDSEFDFVFSTFVLEHCVRPRDFLDECYRILRPGGRLVIFCPDFIGRGGITSQRVGLSAGIGSVKWRQGKYLDALLTAWDSRVKQPLCCRLLRWLNGFRPRFMVNLRPVCFTDPFQPDVDAVYLTDENELRRYFDGRFRFEQNSSALASYCRVNNLFFINGVKNAAHK